ncbi:TPA: hypothetical protein ACGA31_002760 [Clostridium perfringens]
MLDKQKVQEALEKNFNNGAYLVTVSFLKKSKNIEIKKEIIVKEVETYIKSIKKMVEIFCWEKQDFKYFYTIAEFKNIYAVSIIINDILDEDKMFSTTFFMRIKKLRDLEYLGWYLMKDGIKDVKYSKGFFKGINIS